MRTPRDIGIGELAPLNPKPHHADVRLSTIHGMVYNAMKLFMEVNPQLFDDCSHDYAEQQNNAEEKQRNRQQKWERLTDMAKNRQNGKLPTLPATTTTGGKVNTPLKQEDSDPLSQDSSRRLEQLRLGDDGSASAKERRVGASSVC